MIKIQIWASGAGSNARAITEYFQNHEQIRVAGFLSNKADSGVFALGEEFGIHARLVAIKNWNSPEILSNLKRQNINAIVLAGFLKLVPKEIVNHFNGNMVNVHPSLLPAYGGEGMYGKHVHQAVIDNNELVSGITIHEVNEEYDEGKILAQLTTAVPVSKEVNDLTASIHQLEQEIFPQVIEAWLLSKFSI